MGTKIRIIWRNCFKTLLFITFICIRHTFDRALKKACFSLKTCKKVGLLVVTQSDIVPWCGEGIPRDVEPAVASQELVGIFTCLEEGDQTLELLRVFGANVGGLANEVLRALDSTYQTVDASVAET